MLRIPTDAARDRLANLVEQASRGEDVGIEGDGANVRLVVEVPRPKATFGSARGLVSLADDFDAQTDAPEREAPPDRMF